MQAEPVLPRPQPAYTAWLEKESMLGQAGRLISEVSQTDRIWMFSGRGMSVEPLLRAAPQWLELSSADFPGGAFFSGIIPDLPKLAAAGIKGLYLGPLGEDQSFWQDKGGNPSRRRRLPASLELDPRLGDLRDFEELGKAAENDGLELGADILAASTSMGPDFFLQARHATGRSGLYAMLELPEPLWSEAPNSSTEWEGMALSPAQVELFSAQGILPGSLYRDSRAWGSPAGWAVTGEVRGTDGKPRRWLYRYDGDVKSPVLLWQDPSGLAARLFSASIIQQTGFWRIPLAGLRLDALMGLEPQARLEGGSGDISAQSFSPGLEALNILSEQIHRYGGWALQADPVPAELVERILSGSCDFCREDTSEKLLLEAVEKKDPSKLASLYRRWLEIGLDLRRMARGFNAENPLSSAQERPYPAEEARELTNVPPSLHWHIGLPGLAFLSPSELGLDTGGALPHDRASTLERATAMKRLLGLRAEYGLAQGKLIKLVEGGNSALALLSALPQKGYWLLATNFSDSPARIALALPEKCQSALDALSGKELSGQLDENGQSFSFSLESFATRQVIILSH